jgi:hypothetical protein
MKTVTTLFVILCSITTQCQTTDKLQAFDGTIHFSVGSKTGNDNYAMIAAGISGRRIPISFFVGSNYEEFSNDFQRLNLKQESTLGWNATLMTRLCHIEFRTMDLNAYTTIYKEHDNILFEHGAKIGILLNDRTRLYLNAGYMYNKASGKDLGYRAVVVGVSFSLFFFNGYSAY